MDALQLEVSLQSLNVSPGGPEDGRLLVWRDLPPEERPTHLDQASVFDEGVRLLTGEVTCEGVLEMIVEQFVS